MTGRSERIISAYSCSARIAATPASAKSHQPPAHTTRRTSGRPTIVTSTREIRGGTTAPAGAGAALLVAALAAAEAAPAAGVVVESRAKLVLAEVRPERVDEDELGVGELPQEEIGDPQLTGGANQEVWVGHLGRVQVRRECLLVDLAPGAHRAVGSVDDLRAPAVVECNPEAERAVVLGLPLECRHPLPQRGGRAVAAADEPRAHSLAHEVGQLALDRLREDLHQQLHLFERARPVLGGKGVDGERVDAEVDCGLDRAAQCLRAGAMAGRDREAAPARPAGIAVHDDRDRVRDVRKIGLGRRPHMAERPDLCEQAHTSMISASLCFKRSSIVFVWSSVSFWTFSSARRSSSVPTSFSSFRWCTASRRTLRTATFPSSAILRTTFTSSFRRSSVGCGIGSRTTLPSFDGVRPRSDSWIAFSIALIELGSNGWIVSIRGSGTLIVASCFSGVEVP